MQCGTTLAILLSKSKKSEGSKLLPCQIRDQTGAGMAKSWKNCTICTSESKRRGDQEMIGIARKEEPLFYNEENVMFKICMQFPTNWRVYVSSERRMACFQRFLFHEFTKLHRTGCERHNICSFCCYFQEITLKTPYFH